MSPEGWEFASRVLDGLAERLREFVVCSPLLLECASDRRAILLLGGPPCLEALDQTHKSEVTRMGRRSGMHPDRSGTRLPAERLCHRMESQANAVLRVAVHRDPRSGASLAQRGDGNTGGVQTVREVIAPERLSL